MRFVIREQEYEQPLAAGKFSYSGQMEKREFTEEWRLNQAVDGYYFMHLDIDGRRQPNPFSTLFHITLDNSFAVERLKLRHLVKGSETKVDLVRMDGNLAFTSISPQGRYEQEFDPGNDPSSVPGSTAPIWFASTIGLFLLADQLKRMAGDGQAVTLRLLSPGLDHQEYQQTHFSLIRAEAIYQQTLQSEVEIDRRIIISRPCLITSKKQTYRLWLDSYDLPVRSEIESLSVAVETRYVRYRPELLQEINRRKAGKHQ